MRKLKIFFVFTLSVFLFSSCLTSRQKNLLREPGGSIPSYPQVEAIGEYTIKPGDELSVQISVPSEESKTGRVFRLFSAQNTSNNVSKLSTLAVTPSGTIYFPYIGDIYVMGKTTLEIQTEIEKILNQELFVEEESCIVHVRLANRSFSVIGQSRSGNYSIAKEQLTIYQALSQSGDIAAYGDRSKVKIIRQTEDGVETRVFDLRSQDIVNSEYYYVQPNDVIYVQPLGRQFLGLNTFGSVFSIISTVASLGISIYYLVEKF
ncbi:polysaccharide biosynthesis/export family protein [Bacteroidales bacterium OttesenSCG-928-A17]|nr:polysaccharide biosynthesis/export family protein [Bacteroidales bacterium OttesenSCG-928-A17]